VPPAGHAYELWLVRGSAPPLALGVIGPGGRFEVAPDGLPGGRLEGGETLAVSLEIPGGAPDGVPGGPILFTGTLVPLAPAGGR
jgi:anti-sigma-K factor RskA